MYFIRGYVILISYTFYFTHLNTNTMKKGKGICPRYKGEHVSNTFGPPGRFCPGPSNNDLENCTSSDSDYDLKINTCHERNQTKTSKKHKTEINL
jgi:hypothetical protein